MALPHAKSGDKIDLNNLLPALGGHQSVSLLRSQELQLIRLVLAAGQEMPDHRVDGEITVLCLEGEVEFSVETTVTILTPNTLIHLQGQQPHALKARKDAVLLLTICQQPANPSKT